MNQSYNNISERVAAAGFFTTSVEDMGGWDRITICGERCHPLPGFTGNSFWISLTRGMWFLGTWGGTIYSARSELEVIAFSIAWLKYESSKTLSNFITSYVERFNLTVANDEFENIIAKSE